jgi:hypothetical protein
MVMSMKNSSGTIGNRTRDLPACSAVPPHVKCTTTNVCFVHSCDMQTDASPMATRHREGAGFLYEMR